MGVRTLRPAVEREEESGFAAGELLAGRYRVVRLLGRGGMGDIYQVEDLKLGQAVALKFLPGWLAADGVGLARFHREVRLARQVSHPNVCRVFDVGEARGLPFLSMEYIDGEDLETVLKRSGRLPQDRAMEAARQLCGGLAAIHDAGVLHRDLKPANVMIDRRGRVRITDFGVAALAGELSGEPRAGTPAYMAPEQVSGGEITVRSDLYSLGLVLYEMFSGRRPFRQEDRERTRPAMPLSQLVGDMDPAAERTILRCLESEPRERPGSALAVARALPGGDPLAAALAAGETPSPEMVAAAPKVGSLAPIVAAACLGAVLVCLLAVLTLSGRTAAWRQVPLPRPPEALADRARALLARFGYPEPPADVAYGFGLQEDLSQYLGRQAGSGASADVARAKHLLAGGRPPLYWFWYRQSPAPLVASDIAVTRENPPLKVPGEALIVLDPEGRLYHLEVVPTRIQPPAPSGPTPDWDLLLRTAGLDPRLLSRSKPLTPPTVFADHRAAWKGGLPEVAGTAPPGPVRIESASYRGRPVSFEIVGPWRAPQPKEVDPGPARRAWTVTWSLFTRLATLVTALALARRNLRLGRGDLMGAWRLALVMTVVTAAGWMSSGLRVVPLSLAPVQGAGGADSLTTALRAIVTNAALAWCSYVAVEPLVRRRWPQRIVSWTRLLAGYGRDPMVGRDLLVGCLLGLGISLVFAFEVLTADWMGAWPRLRLIQPATLLGLPGVTRQLSIDLPLAASESLSFVVLFLLLQMVLRRERWVVGVLAVFHVVAFTASSASPILWLALLCAVLKMTLHLFVWMRFGLLADLVARLVYLLVLYYPLSPDLSAWYSGATLFVLLAVIGVAVYGFVTSTVGRPWFRNQVLVEQGPC
ncbi:MAG TPA: serine/threonine-protein kinase [Thermoanaerobaculia bacterium]|jgi:serine/threonine-protein kinase|nr:serine/threonine-protein kinase [Thermoanaerobaculia bacterium]